MTADPTPADREKCWSSCPCICHDGFGGAHPNQDCRDAQPLIDRVALAAHDAFYKREGARIVGMDLWREVARAVLAALPPVRSEPPPAVWGVGSEPPAHSHEFHRVHGPGYRCTTCGEWSYSSAEAVSVETPAPERPEVEPVAWRVDLDGTPHHLSASRPVLDAGRSEARYSIVPLIPAAALVEMTEQRDRALAQRDEARVHESQWREAAADRHADVLAARAALARASGVRHS